MNEDWSSEKPINTPEPPIQGQLVLDIEGFSGPLDMLLELARWQKVDLAAISILELTEQYLSFVDHARDVQIELAADYLVMAAWLAFLKSKLLVPKDDDEEELSGEELAEQLHFRLKRLQAMREAGEQLSDRSLLGRQRFATAHARPIERLIHTKWQANYHDLLKAYATNRQSQIKTDFKPVQRKKVWSVHMAQKMLGDLLDATVDWQSLQSFLAKYLNEDANAKSAMATSFSVCLEMAKMGKAELSQAESFAPLYIRHPQKGFDHGTTAAKIA